MIEDIRFTVDLNTRIVKIKMSGHSGSESSILFSAIFEDSEVIQQIIEDIDQW